VRGGGAEREDAGVVDQDVDVAAAELDGLAGQLARAGLAGQRGGDEVGLAAGGADALDGLVAAGGVSPVHDDVGAVQGQAGGGGAP
jgi:hypothetical protein